MDTYFASPERANNNELLNQLELITDNTVINEVMNMFNGLLAILNKDRQIIALNTTLLKILGVEDINEVFGLRPGEALQCIHYLEGPGGCGTSKSCSTCGAAIAIVTSIVENKPVEENCSLAVNRSGIEQNLFFRVRAHPINIRDNQFILLFLNDITKYQQMATLERVFFHDLNNIISGLLGTSELMLIAKEKRNEELTKRIYHLSRRLAQEVAIQRCLIQEEKYQTNLELVTIEQVIKGVEYIFGNHSVAKDKRFHYCLGNPRLALTTDLSLLLRVLTNILKNAFEASEEGGRVRLSIEENEGIISFGVWNRQSISENVRGRIFERNFSTKDGIGRGLGTYSMKFFGEKILGGAVSFTSSEAEGTNFYFKIPIGPKFND
jgi:signal transduction histidine kinase